MEPSPQLGRVGAAGVPRATLLVLGRTNILPSIDAEILEVVVDAAGPNVLRLEGEAEEPTDYEAAMWLEIS